MRDRDTAGGEPSGAVIVVWRLSPAGPEFLVLRRAVAGLADDADWAWGPPSGCLEAGESITQCAARELVEETGLVLPLTPVGDPSARWPLFLAEAPADAVVRLSFEHDQYAWLSLDRASSLTRPDLVRAQLHTAARYLRPALRDREW